MEHKLKFPRVECDQSSRDPICRVRSRPIHETPQTRKLNAGMLPVFSRSVSGYMFTMTVVHVMSWFQP